MPLTRRAQPESIVVARFSRHATPENIYAHAVACRHATPPVSRCAVVSLPPPARQSAYGAAFARCRVTPDDTPSPDIALPEIFYRRRRVLFYRQRQTRVVTAAALFASRHVIS